MYTSNNHVLHTSRFYVLFVSSRTAPVLLLLLFVYIDDQNAKIYRENKNGIVLSLVSLFVPNPNKTPLGLLELEARECRSIHLDMQLIRSRPVYIFRCKINAHECSIYNQQEKHKRETFSSMASIPESIYIPTESIYIYPLNLRSFYGRVRHVPEDFSTRILKGERNAKPAK